MELVFALFFAVSCGDDHSGDDAHGHDFTNYAQCYNHHTEEESVPPQDALDECDEYFAEETAFADRDACLAYYAAIPSVPTAEAETHCTARFP
jgi:hypothetical protein